MPIRVSCPSCQKALVAPDQLAGRNCRCKACSNTFRVPDLPAPEPAAPDFTATTDFAPAPQPAARPTAFRSKNAPATKKGVPALVWVGVAAFVGLILITGAGVAAWQVGIFGGGRGPGGLTATEMRYLADETDLIVTFDADALAAGKTTELVLQKLQSRGTATEKVKAKIEQQQTQFNEWARKEISPGTDMTPGDVRRVVASGSPAREEAVYVLTTRRPMNPATLTKGLPVAPKQTTVGKYNLYEGNYLGSSAAFCLVDETTLVFSNKPELLRSILERNRAAQLPAATRTLLQGVDSTKVFTLAYNAIPLIQKQAQQAQNQAPKGAMTIDLMKMVPAEWQAATRATGATMEFDVRGGLNFNCSLACKDNDDAASLRKVIDGGLTVVRERSKQQLTAAKNDQEKSQIEKGMTILDKFQIQATGVDLKASLSLTPDTLADLAEAGGNDLPGLPFGGQPVAPPVVRPVRPGLPKR
jgi:hypothetical protein